MAKTASKVKEALSPSTAVTLAPSSGLTALPAGLKVKRILTVPSLVLKVPGEGRALYFVSAIRVSKVVKKAVEGQPVEKPANIADVGDVATGEQFIFLVPSVVQSNLERDYPNEDYVGKTFYIENAGKRTQSQRYNDFKIFEVEQSTEV